MKKQKSNKRYLTIGLLVVAIVAIGGVAFGGENLKGLFRFKAFEQRAVLEKKVTPQFEFQQFDKGQFIPGALNALPITRGEFSKLIVQEMGVNPDPAIYTNCFSDTNGHWAENYICYLADSGVYNTTSPNFRPNDTLNRAEAAKIFTIAFDLTSLHVFSLYDDVPPHDWYTPYVNILAANGIPAEEIGDNFRPADTIQTGEAGHWINSVLGHLNDTTNPALMTRGGFIAIVVKSLNIPYSQMQATIPCGAAQGSEYEVHVCYLVSEGIIDSPSFPGPNSLILRAEAAKIFVQTFGLTMPGINDYAVYDDIAPSQWYTAYVNIVGMLNIPAEEIGEDFRPVESITKAETQAWLNNL